MKKENIKLLEENAILSAKLVEEDYLIDGVEEKVSILKVRFSKWLDTEKINVEVYKYDSVVDKIKITQDSKSKTVKSRHITTKATTGFTITIYRGNANNPTSQATFKVLRSEDGYSTGHGLI